MSMQMRIPAYDAANAMLAAAAIAAQPAGADTHPLQMLIGQPKPDHRRAPNGSRDKAWEIVAALEQIRDIEDTDMILRSHPEMDPRQLVPDLITAYSDIRWLRYWSGTMHTTYMVLRRSLAILAARATYDEQAAQAYLEALHRMRTLLLVAAAFSEAADPDASSEPVQRIR